MRQNQSDAGAVQAEQEAILTRASERAAQLEAVASALAAEALRRHGWVRLIARGASMLPAIWPGDELEIIAARPEELRPGDIAVCLVGGQIRIHRVRQVVDESLVTQGDNHAQPDAPIAFAEVYGRVQRVRRRGAAPLRAEREGLAVRIVHCLLARSDALRALALRLRRTVAGC